jgi:hypothetical protein
MSKNEPTFISINNGKISCGFHIFFKSDENGMFSWFIPGFNIRFSSTTKEAGDKRAIIMVKAYFNYWIERVSFREFILNIHRSGFKAAENHELTVSKILSKKLKSAKFKSLVQVPAPSDYTKSEVLETELAIAKNV